MPKETFFTAISCWRMVSRRALDASGFWQGSPQSAGRARQRPAHSRQHRYLVPPGDGVLRKAVQAERQPYSGALLQHLEAQPVGLNELGLHIRHPAYRPDPTIPRRRHRPAVCPQGRTVDAAGGPRQYARRSAQGGLGGLAGWTPPVPPVKCEPRFAFAFPRSGLDRYSCSEVSVRASPPTVRGPNLWRGDQPPLASGSGHWPGPPKRSSTGRVYR